MMNCGHSAREAFRAIESKLSYNEEDLQKFCVPTDVCDWILHQFLTECIEEIAVSCNTYNPYETKDQRITRYMALMDQATIQALGEDMIIMN